jgi:hypothetical protein
MSTREQVNQILGTVYEILEEWDDLDFKLKQDMQVDSIVNYTGKSLKRCLEIIREHKKKQGPY